MHYHSRKFTKFHAFIYAFFKQKKKIKNSYSIKIFMHVFFKKKKKIKFHAFSFKLKFIFNQKFHACIIQKRIKKSNFMHSYMHSSKITKQKKNQVLCIHKCILQKNKSKRQKEFMHSNRHFHSENSQSFMHS